MELTDPTKNGDVLKTAWLERTLGSYSFPKKKDKRLTNFMEF